jgi:hypothetical protein
MPYTAPPARTIPCVGKNCGGGVGFDGINFLPGTGWGSELWEGAQKLYSSLVPVFGEGKVLSTRDSGYGVIRSSPIITKKVFSR